VRVHTRFGLHGIFIFLLVVAALCLPLPLYLAALAIFGLPHVIWEMAFIRSHYALRWPLVWWRALWLVLLLQASVRTAVWLGVYSSQASQMIDLLTLVLLGIVIFCAPKNSGALVRLSGLLLASCVYGALAQGQVLTALLVLAMAHNFTPLALVWDLARTHPPARILAWGVSALLMLPLLVAGSGWSGAVTPMLTSSYLPLLEGQLPQSWEGSHRQALLSAIVLAQCLHYYCVMYWLPAAEVRRTGLPLISLKLRGWLLLACGLMLGYFVSDYNAARKLYAVAAGIHAWMEWPVLLMAFLCVRSVRGTR